MKKTTGAYLCIGTVMLVVALGLLYGALGYHKIKLVLSKSWATQKRVALVPLSDIGNVDVRYVKYRIKNFYGFEVVVLPAQAMPQSAYYKPRNRYKARLVLDHLTQIVPCEFDKVIALTSKDISTSVRGYSDWGVIGLAYLDQEQCVVSSFRLGKDKVSRSKYQDRLAKASLHEVGHTLGLRHCTASSICFMVDAKGKVATIDNVRIDLCEKCREQLDLDESYLRDKFSF